MSDWLEKFREKREQDKKVKEDLSKQILELLKGADRVSVVPEVLADIFRLKSQFLFYRYYSYQNFLKYKSIILFFHL